MKLVPLGDRVVLKELKAEETTKSGIVLPGQAQEKPQQAEVIAVGPGKVEDGKEVKMEVAVGDQVIYSKYAGTNVKLEDEEYIIVKQDDILAVAKYSIFRNRTNAIFFAKETSNSVLPFMKRDPSTMSGVLPSSSFSFNLW